VATLDRATTTILEVNGVSGYTWNGTIEGSVAPTIDAITLTPDGTPADGYLPLRLFAVPVIPGMGDESLVNFNVPAFQWGREVYTRIAVDSNGYVVVGGGTANPDNQFVPQTFPNPTRPNNVIAPWWTDINLAAAGCPAPACGARIATLTDTETGDSWLVVDWENVPTFGFGQTNTDRLHDFQIWLGLNGDTSPVEDVSIAYGDLGIPSPDGLNAGAENRDGTSGINITPLPTDGQEYVITTSPALPGGKVEITFEAEGQLAGDYILTARMTSNLTFGTTTAQATVKVVP
jgi:hypothetical protein